MQMPIAAATPSAVRSFGRTQLGSRRAIAVSTRFSWRASRKFGSRTALTADIHPPRNSLLTIGQQSYSDGELQLQRQLEGTPGPLRPPPAGRPPRPTLPATRLHR